MNEKKTATTNNKILNGCTPCLLTMRQEDQSFNKALLGQNNQMIIVNNDRIRIQLGANPFLLVGVLKLKMKNKKEKKSFVKSNNQ